MFLEGITIETSENIFNETSPSEKKTFVQPCVPNGWRCKHLKHSFLTEYRKGWYPTMSQGRAVQVSATISFHYIDVCIIGGYIG